MSSEIQRPGERTQDLYVPGVVSIFVGPNHRRFTILRESICRASEYFGKKDWTEGQTGATTLDDTQEWIFESFKDWIYTGRLAREPRPYALSGSLAVEEASDSQNPIRWIWRDLFEVYIFADRYDTKGLRRTAMEAIQTKYFSIRVPHMRDLAFALGNLPDTSPLYQFLFDALVWHYQESDAAEFEYLGHSILAVLTYRLAQIVVQKRCRRCSTSDGNVVCRRHEDVRKNFGLPDHRQDMCAYHEHETKESEDLCHEKWRVLNAKHGMNLGCFKSGCSIRV